jgi:Immunoglobulin I-set domain
MSEVVPSQQHTFTTVHRFYSRLPVQFIILLSMLLLLPGSVIGQAVNKAWTSTYPPSGSFADEGPGAMTLDASGNIYIAGISESATTRSPRVAIVKYDAQGNQLWATLYGTNMTYVYFGDLQVDGNGNVFLTGYNSEKGFVIKYDENGNQLSEIISTNLTWGVRMFALQPSGAFSLLGLKDYGIHLAVENYDPAGNLLSVKENTMQFYPQGMMLDVSNNIVMAGSILDTNCHSQLTIAKYDSACTLLWTNCTTLPDTDSHFGSFTTDTNGNIFLVGTSVGTNGQGKIILLKYDSQGLQEWTSDLGKGSGFDPNWIGSDGFGNLFVTESDFTAIKCDNHGTKQWQSRPALAGKSTLWQATPTLDRSGNLYISGILSEYQVQLDCLTLKFDTEGHEVWAQGAYGPTTNLETLTTILKVDDSNNVYVTGYFSSGTNYYDISNRKLATTKYTQTNVAGLPAISHDPESLRATEFTTVTFNVTATGDGPLRYQWSFNNHPISGATNANLILTNVQENALGAYSVTISNSVGWIKSREATLALNIPPIIDNQPQSLSMAMGESALLNVYAHGDLPLSFQWQYNGTDLPGATNATNIYSYVGSSLILSNVSLANQGNYRVIISNSFGMVTSAVAQVRVTAQIHSQWTSVFAGPSSQYYVFYSGLASTDDAGNIYFSGRVADSNTNSDYVTVKLDSSGHQLWSKTYAGTGGDDMPISMVLDRWGNVYVTGSSQATNGVYQFATVKYDTNGNLLWVARDEGTNGSGGFPWQITVDDDSNVFVAGISYDASNNYSYETTKYNSNGEQVWQVCARPIDYFPEAFSLTVDHNGDVWVAGNGGVIKYSSSGTELWRSSPDVNAYQIKSDASNNVYVLTLAFTPDTQAAFGVQKYDSNGQLLWSSTYASSGMAIDLGDHFCVGEDGSVFVAGTTTTDNWRTSDYLTVKFGPEGQFLWAARFSEGSNTYNGLRGLAIDDTGNAYVTGTTAQIGGAGYITTLKYDENGNQLWSTRYSPPSGVVDCMDVLLANKTNIFVTTATAGLEEGADYNYTVIAYNQTSITNALSILAPPQNQMAFVNSNAVLNVTGTGRPLQYQWRHFGNQIPGATNSTLIIPNFQPQDGGEYSVILDNGTDITISPEARLTPYTQLFPTTPPAPRQFSFTLVGEQSRTFEVQRSSDLVIWDSLTNLFNTNGVIGFTDTSLTNGAKAFYRARKSQ